MALFAVGYMASPSHMPSEFARLSVTMVGLLAAGALPAASLLIGSLSGKAATVASVEDHFQSIWTTVKALLRIVLGAVVVTVLFLILSILNEEAVLLPIGGEDGSLDVFFARLVQGCLLCISLLIVLDARTIPRALYDTLCAKQIIAIEEARERLLSNAPKSEAIRASFGPDDKPARRISMVPSEK